MDKREIAEHQEFERIAAYAAQQADAEAQAQAGNPHFRSHSAPEWVKAGEETWWAWGASPEWRRDAESAKTQKQRDKLTRDAHWAFWQ